MAIDEKYWNLRRLWQNVIIQAIRDALMDRNSMTGSEHMNRDRARDWLEGRTEDFEHVCQLAGIDPKQIVNWWQVAKSDPDTQGSLKALMTERLLTENSRKRRGSRASHRRIDGSGFGDQHVAQ